MAWLERLDRRGRSSRTYQDSADPTRHALDIVCGTPLHYESVPDSGVFDAVIDCTPQRVKTAALDGWRITQNGFHYALGKPAGKSDGWVGFGGRGGAHWFSFRLARVGYLHWPTRAWQNIGGNPTYDRANLTSEVNRTAPMADGAELPVSSIARWSNIWQTPSGGALDISWRVDGARLKEEVTINAAGRAWIAANRKPTTKANETWFGFVFQLDWSDVPRVVRQSVLQSIDGDFADDGLPLELRDAADRLLGLLPVDDLIVRNGEDETRIPLQKRFWRDGDGNHYLLVGVRCDVLAGLPAGDLVFDPTIALQPDGTAGMDTHIITDLSGNFGSETTVRVGHSSSSDSTYRTLIKFDLTGLPTDATVTATTLSLYMWAKSLLNNRTMRVYRQKRSWTEGGATWFKYDGSNNWQTAGGFGVNDCEQTDIGNRAFTTSEPTGFKDFSLTPTSKADLDFGNGWMIKIDTEYKDLVSFRSSETDTVANRPKLYIEYTEGGGEPQAYTLEAGAGSYTLTGTAADLLAGRVLDSAAGEYTLTGAAANLLRGLNLSAEAGNYTLSGTAADLLTARLLPAEGGSYSLTGQTASLLRGYVLSGEAAAYTLTGQDADLLAGRVLAAEGGAYTLTGADADLLAHRILGAEAGAYTLTGLPVTLLYSGDLTPTPVSRTYVIRAENRVYVIAAENRTHPIAAENRVCIITAENRTHPIAAENRTYTVKE